MAYLGKVKDSRICDTLESSFDVFSVLSLLVDFNPSAIIDPLKDIKQKLRILGALDHLRDKMLSLLPEVTEWIGGITLNLFLLQSAPVTSEALSNLLKQYQVAFINHQ